MFSIFENMDIFPGPSAAVRVDAVGCRTSSRLRSQPLEFWRNEERPKESAPQRLEFANPEAHRSRGHRRALPEPQGSVAKASDKVTKQQANSATHAESLHRMYDNGAAASMPADPGVLPGNVYNSRTQREPVEDQEQPKRIGENSGGRCRKAEKVREGAALDRNPAGHTVAATKPLPSVRLPSQTTRRAAHAVAAADQTANTHLSPDLRQADTGVAPLKGKPTQNEAGHHLGNAASSVAGFVPVTTAAKAAGSGAAEVQSAVAREDAGKVLAAGTPVVKSGIRRTRGDPVLRSAILVRDMAEALGQVAGPGSASDQDRIGARRSRKAAHNVQSGKLTAAQKGSLGVAAAAPETAGTKMTANVRARVQPQESEDVSPAQVGADVGTKCDKKQSHTVGFVRTRPTHQAAPRNREPPGAPLKMKPKSKSASNPKAKAKSTGSSAAAAGTRRSKRQQQLSPGLSLPAAREPEQDVDEEEAYRPRKRARKANVQEPGDPDARERTTGSAAGHESERDSERALCTRICTKPWAATVAEVCRQQVAKESATAEDESAVRGQKKRGRKPTKASAAEAGIAAQPTSQPEPNIPSQQAAPGDAGGPIGDAGPGKAPEEALGNAPPQLHHKSVPSVMTSVGDGSRDCKAAVCAETLLQAAERIAPQRGTSVQHQVEQPANLAGDQHIDQRPQHDPIIAPAIMRDAVEVPIEHGMGAMATPAAEAVPKPGMDGCYSGGRNLPATTPAVTGDAAHVVFKAPAPRPRPQSPSESVVQSNGPWIRNEEKACNRQQDFLLQGIQKMTTERGPFGATVRMLARRLYCPEVWRASGEATMEKRLVHDNGEGTSQQPGTARAAEVADGSGGTGNRQESGRTAEDSGRNAAGGPSQTTRRIMGPPLFNVRPSFVPNTNGDLAVHDAAQPGSSGRGLGRPLRDTDWPVRVTHGPLEASWFGKSRDGTADTDTAVPMDSLPDPATQLRQTAEQEHAHDHVLSWSGVQAAQMHPSLGQQQFYCSPKHNTHGQHSGEQSGRQQSWRRLKWQLPKMAHAEPCSQHRLQTVPNEAAEIQEPPHRPSPAPQQQQRDDVAQRPVQEELLWGCPAVDRPDAGQDAGQDSESQLHLASAPPQQLHARSQGITRSLECAEPTKSQEQQRQPQLQQQFLVPRLRASRFNQQQPAGYSQSGETGSQQQQLSQRVPVADGRAVMYASQPRRRSSCSAPAQAPASAPSAAESFRRAFSRAGDLQKRIKTRQPDNIDREEDGWTPDQVSDLQAAYYNTDPTLPNFWREVAKGVRGRTAAECFNRVFGSAQDGEDRALFAKVLRRHNPVPAAGGGVGRPLTLAAARKRSQKAHEQELLERIARLERSDAESDGEAENCEQGGEDEPPGGGDRANEPSGATGTRRRRRPLPPIDPMEVREILDDLKRTHHAHRFITSFLNKQGGWVKWHKAAKEASDHRLEAAGSAPSGGSNPNQAGPTARTVRPRNDSLTHFIGSMLSKETARKQRQEWREDDRVEGLDDEDDVCDEYSTEEMEESEDKERGMLLQYLVEEGLAEPDALPAL
ncbi:hypothetical protein VaNZ11_011842 [Volvox africanus]|uniref:Myb-like domain-containing protein n=1 Tax=Volvox africanus TaxID=51714 RepID=A0ABQ5SCG6_9CHLO|nr:hypothetical protein VaNZ11_011842 [Volvox africanus]